MSKSNSRKESFLGKFQVFSVDSISGKFLKPLSFNFQFFDNSQSCGQDFKDWTQEQLFRLLDKLKEYSKLTMVELISQKTLVIYGDFPNPSDFTHPRHIPIDVKWGRFRLEGDCRLCGFIVNEVPGINQNTFKPNIFYVVFLDAFHKFYRMEKS